MSQAGPNVVEEICALFARRGAEAYLGERLSMREHMLQSAHFAQQERSPPALVLAALLHDIGHLLEEVTADVSDWRVDAHHEEVGGRWLARHFSPAVSEPVRLHVPAKRYLCAIDPRYFSRLSEASVLTLKLQGGPMSQEEVAAFEAERFHREAVRVRRWDDQGKVVGLRTPPLEHYRELIAAEATRAIP